MAYVNPNASQPWVNFQQDFTAILFLFLIIIFFIRKIKNIYVPNFILLSGSLIFIFVFFQMMWGIYYFKQDVALFLVYFSIFCISYIIAFNNFIEINKVFVTLIFVSVISVFIQTLQWVNVDSIFIRQSYAGRPSGNLGQPNQLSTLLFMGLYSLTFIRKKAELNYLIYIIISFFIIFGIALTDSRTAWAVLFLSLIIILLRDRSKLKDILLKIFFYLVSLIFIKLINTAHILNSNSEIRNLESLRFYNWNQLLEAIIQRPYFGYGANQTALAQSIISEKIESIEYLTYSHNIIMDSFLWFGIPVGLVLFIGFCFLFFKKYYCNHELDTYILLLITAFLIHCNLEYPFAYAYFLIPIGIIMGFYYKGNSHIINKKYFYTFLTLVFFALMILFFEYLYLKKEINEMSYKAFPEANSQVYKYKIIDALSYSEQYKFKDYCNESLRYKEKEHFQNIYYRYPSGKNIYLYTYSSIGVQDINNKLKKYLSYQVKDVDKAINIMIQKVADCD